MARRFSRAFRGRSPRGAVASITCTKDEPYALSYYLYILIVDEADSVL
ncbi:MAG: hypothetical protein K5873_04370 [Treponema sp.]|nr:hypothetical protein [Treponema sp.]